MVDEVSVETLVQRIVGLGYVSITTDGAYAQWLCSLLVNCDGEECNYYGRGATIHEAVLQATEEAWKAQVERILYQ